MPHNRFFTEDLLEKNSLIQIREKELQHLVQVMRAKIGDKVEIVDGKGWLAEGIIASLQKQQASIEITKKEFSKGLESKLILACAVPLMNHLDFILEKGTELGVDEFWLHISSKSQSLSKERVPRLQSLIVAALKQSGRLYLPKITFFSSLESIPKNQGSYYFGDLSPKAEYPQISSSQNLILFIGPEGGYTEQEIHFIKTHFSALGIKLSENILRAETAALAGAVLLSIQRK